MTISGTLFILLFSALLLGACTAPTPTPSPTPSPTQTASPLPTASPTPMVSTPPSGVPGGTLVAIATADISHRDVHQTVSETLASRGPGIAYSRLLRLRTDASVAQPSLLLECDLCQSWEMLDHLTYRFLIRQGVHWQDLPPVNGRALTAEDLVFSYQRQRTRGWPNAPLLLALDTVEAEDGITLKVTLKFPDVDFLLSLADGHSKVVAWEVVEGPGGLMEGPVVGTGPWVWRQTEEGVGSDFEANPSYFEEGLPFPRQLSFKAIPDPEVQLAAFLNGQVDVYDVPPQTWPRLQSFGVEYGTFLSRQGGRGLVLAMNVSRPPFNDVQVRRALFKALEPWAYLDEIWAGQGFVSTGVPVVEAPWLLGRGEMGEFFAGAASAEGGLGSSGVAFDLIIADFGDIYLDQGFRIERDLRNAGFVPSLKVVDPVEYSEQVWQRKDYQIFAGPVPPTSSPNSYLFSILHGGGQWNILVHSDLTLSELIEAQQEAPFSSPQRRDVLRAIQRRLLEQAYMLGSATSGTVWALQDRVRGFYPNTALSEYFYWAKAWLAS